jgi:fucose permease
VLVPQIREAFDLSLVQVGFVLDSVWIGGLLTLLPWGLLADRVGERIVLAAGLVGCAAALVAAGHADTFGAFFVLLFFAGAAGASVKAGGRSCTGSQRPSAAWPSVSVRPPSLSAVSSPH